MAQGSKTNFLRLKTNNNKSLDCHCQSYIITNKKQDGKSQGCCFTAGSLHGIIEITRITWGKKRKNHCQFTQSNPGELEVGEEESNGWNENKEKNEEKVPGTLLWSINKWSGKSSPKQFKLINPLFSPMLYGLSPWDPQMGTHNQ